MASKENDNENKDNDNKKEIIILCSCGILVVYNNELSLFKHETSAEHIYILYYNDC